MNAIDWIDTFTSQHPWAVGIGIGYALFGSFSALCWQGGMIPSCYLPFKPTYRYWPDLLGIALRTSLWIVWDTIFTIRVMQNSVVFMFMATPDEWAQHLRGDLPFLPERMSTTKSSAIHGDGHE